MRKFKPKNKTRWVLRGFQDKQKEYQQTDSPASTRPGFRMICQMAANKSWDLFHIDLETAFLQGQSYDVKRDAVCQLTPEASHPPSIAARLKKPSYGINDAPRRWWNILDEALRGYGSMLLRWEDWIQGAIAQQSGIKETFTDSFEKTLDPTAGSPAAG